MKSLRLFINEITDKFIRDNFQRISNFIQSQDLLAGDFKFFQLDLDGTANQIVSHNLGFLPKDVIFLGVTDSESVTFNYDSFTRDVFSITSTGSCTVRFFAGRYSL